ncbi:MAG: hypothetical protein H0U12_02240, partial [Thermoleophilaceae bacterium]|nr:hypothetical protein [Thermoleophilaceae bacterium]
MSERPFRGLLSGGRPPTALRWGASAAVSVTARLGLLAASLRAGGVRLGVGELLAAHRALAAVDPASRDDAYHALRVALCSRRDDLAVFDAAFEACFGRPGGERPGKPAAELPDEARLVLPRVSVPDPARVREEPVGLEAVPAAASTEELLRDKDFAQLTEAERALARRELARLAARGPRRPSRRLRP